MPCFHEMKMRVISGHYTFIYPRRSQAIIELPSVESAWAVDSRLLPLLSAL
jgi:hypothetical protein